MFRQKVNTKYNVVGTLFKDSELYGNLVAGNFYASSAQPRDDRHASVGNIYDAGWGRCEDFSQLAAEIRVHYRNLGSSVNEGTYRDAIHINVE